SVVTALVKHKSGAPPAVGRAVLAQAPEPAKGPASSPPRVVGSFPDEVSPSLYIVPSRPAPSRTPQLVAAGLRVVGVRGGVFFWLHIGAQVAAPEPLASTTPTHAGPPPTPAPAPTEPAKPPVVATATATATETVPATPVSALPPANPPEAAKSKGRPSRG